MALVPLIEMADYDFTPLPAGASLTIPARQIDVEPFGSGRLFMRLHAAVIPPGASIVVEVRGVAPSDEDPAPFFRGPVLAAAEFTSASVAPTLTTGTARIWSGAVATFLRIRQGSSGGTFTFTLSADLGVIDTVDGWSPVDLGARLKLWLDVRDQVIVSGAVSDWGDQSAANNDFTQPTSSLRPGSGRAINAQPAPDFDGSNDLLDLVGGGAMTAIAAASAYHVFVVARFDAITRNQPNAYDNHVLIGDTGAFWALAVGTPGVQGMNWDGALKATPAIPVVTGVDYLIEWSFDGATIRCRVGSAPAQSIASGAISNTTFSPRIGRGWASSGYLDGPIASLLCCNDYLGDLEAGAVRGYLSTLYGVPA